MKKLLLMVMACVAAFGAQAQNGTKPAIPRDAKIEAKVEKTLAKMTLDEKIGQMLELNLDIMGKYDASGKWQLNETMLDTLISKYKVGSILNAPSHACRYRCPVAGVDTAHPEKIDEVYQHSRHLRSGP